MKEHLFLAIKAAIEAGQAIMDVYAKDINVDFKDDQSPLTEADRESDRIIHSVLKYTFPIISEESKALPFEQRKTWDKFWLVDPLDGTKEFIKRNGEFTVNIALIENNLPVLGVVFLPVTSELYFGSNQTGSYHCILPDLNGIEDVDAIINISKDLKNIVLPDVYTIVASRSHMSPETENFIQKCKEKHSNVKLISKGSSIKLCLVAEGKANVYPRLAPTMEWDTAAAHAVAKFAGCDVLNFYTKNELTYNKENLLNPYFIVLR